MIMNLRSYTVEELEIELNSRFLSLLPRFGTYNKAYTITIINFMPYELKDIA